MKKLFALLLALAMLFALAACGEKEPAPSGSGGPGTSQQSEKPADDDRDDNGGDGKESFVGTFDFAKDYMMPKAGSYQGYTEEKYMDGSLKDFYFDVADITEQQMNDYTAELEANGYELKDGENFADGKEYENEDEGLMILIVYMEMDQDYRITVTK